MKPNQVNSVNEQLLRDTVYNYQRLEPTSRATSTVKLYNGKRRLKRLKLKRRRSKFKIGDFVRISRYRTIFEKGYTPNWTTEIFRIRKIQYSNDPITYLLEDYQKNEIKGSFYAEEIQAVMHKDIYLVEKIIRKKNGRVYVKWLSFGPEHNSYILEKDII